MSTPIIFSFPNVLIQHMDVPDVPEDQSECVIYTGTIGNILNLIKFDIATIEVWGGFNISIQQSSFQQFVDAQLTVTVTVVVEPGETEVIHATFTIFDPEDTAERITQNKKQVFDNCLCGAQHVLHCLCFANIILAATRADIELDEPLQVDFKGWKLDA